MTKILASKP